MPTLFPKWMNVLPTVMALGAVGGLATAVGGFWYWATPEFWEVGYMPRQPGAGFNHQLHAGKLGMDCRYCHTKVEKSYEANVPNVATCYGCHAENKLKAWEAHNVSWVREAYAKDAAIEWRRVHKLPDYVHNFPHHAHVAAGISCYSCHGRIDTMPVVFQAHSLSMSWCLDCHRAPEEHIVPVERVTELGWVQQTLQERGQGARARTDAATLLANLKQAPPQNCGACHY